MTGSAGQKRIPVDFLKRFRVSLPPIEEQRRIAAILDKADAIRRKRQQAVALADQFLQSVFLEMFGDPVTNPMGWERVKLGSVLDFLTSGSRGWAKYYSEEGSLFIRINNVRRGSLDLTDTIRVQSPDSAEAKRTLVAPGDVLLSITGDLGRTALVPDSLGPAHINQHLALLRSSSMCPHYLSAFLASPGGQHQFSRLDRVGVKSGLNSDDIRGLSVLVPPDDLQSKFSATKAKIYQIQRKLAKSEEEAKVLSGALVADAIG